MNYIIKVNLDYLDDIIHLGYIGSIKYSFIEKAARGEVKYLDRHGDIAINKMFTLVSKKEARVYNSESKIDEDIKMLRQNFTGLHYSFIKIRVDEETAKAIHRERKH